MFQSFVYSLQAYNPAAPTPHPPPRTRPPPPSAAPWISGSQSYTHSAYQPEWPAQQHRPWHAPPADSYMRPSHAPSQPPTDLHLAPEYPSRHYAGSGYHPTFSDPQALPAYSPAEQYASLMSLQHPQRQQPPPYAHTLHPAQTPHAGSIPGAFGQADVVHQAARMPAIKAHAPPFGGGPGASEFPPLIPCTRVARSTF
jgi:hypothetical protein